MSKPLKSHLEILAQLKKSTCPECGVQNNCAMEEGKSIHSCWCFSEEVKHPLDNDVCLCRTCFKKLNKEN